MRPRVADPPSGGKWGKEHDELAQAEGFASWSDWIYATEKTDGIKICGAKAGSKGKNPHPCGKTAGWGTEHTGSGRCKLHGGGSLIGPDSPSWVDGAHSVYFREGAGAKHRAWFEILLADKELEALNAEISMLRVRLIELTNSLPGIPTGLDFEIAMGELSKATSDMVDWASSQELDWSDSHERGAALRALASQGDAVQVRMEILDGLVEPARVSQRVWDEIRVTIKVLRDVVDTQVRRLKTEYDQTSQAELHAWTVRMQDLIVQHVPPENMKFVVTEIRQWFGWSGTQLGGGTP